MLPLGSPLPEFELPAPSGKIYRSRDFSNAPALLVMFICNHCPYVQHIRPTLAEVTRGFMEQKVAVVGINSNDSTAYPEDAPEAMLQDAARYGYVFPYLVDDDQQVARAFRAACTPDFFLFDQDRRLAYRGQFDDSRPGNALPVTGADLSAAVEALLEGREVPERQKPSIGCNIKWKPGNEPDYFG